MSRALEAPGARLQTLWRRLTPYPGGRWLFSRMLGRTVPYSGSIGARVEAFEPGFARVLLRDRRRVRNHLRSVHAIALANLGELSTGLSLLGALGSDVRAILTRLEVRYEKKARGPLKAEARCEIPPVEEPFDYPVEGRIMDASGDIVAVVVAHWRLGPTGPPRP